MSENKIITQEEWNALNPKDREKWEPVYSYIKSNQEYVRYELLWFKPYINIPRREAE